MYENDDENCVTHDNHHWCQVNRTGHNHMATSKKHCQCRMLRRLSISTIDRGANSNLLSAWVMQSTVILPVIRLITGTKLLGWRNCSFQLVAIVCAALVIAAVPSANGIEWARESHTPQLQTKFMRYKKGQDVVVPPTVVPVINLTEGVVTGDIAFFAAYEREPGDLAGTNLT